MKHTNPFSLVRLQETGMWQKMVKPAFANATYCLANNMKFTGDNGASRPLAVLDFLGVFYIIAAGIEMGLADLWEY